MRQIITLDLRRHLNACQIHSLWREFEAVWSKQPGQAVYPLGFAEGCCQNTVEILVEVNQSEGAAVMKLVNPC